MTWRLGLARPMVFGARPASAKRSILKTHRVYVPGDTIEIWRKGWPPYYRSDMFAPSRGCFKKAKFYRVFRFHRLSSPAAVRYNPAQVLGHVLGQRRGQWCAKSTG